MSDTFDMLREWVAANGTNDRLCEAPDGKFCISVMIEASNTVYGGSVKGSEDCAVVQLSLGVPLTVPEDKRAVVAEVITRAHFAGAHRGRLELDIDTGALRYRGSVNSVNGILSVDVLDRMLGDGLSMLDCWVPAFHAIILGGASARDVVAEGMRDMAVEDDDGSAALTAPLVVRVEKDALEWEHFPGSGKIQEWSRELRAACSAGSVDEDPWDLTGRAALIISDDVDWCVSALGRVAADAGMGFVSFAAEAVADLITPDVVRRFSGPVLLYLQPGLWMQEKDDDQDPDLIASARDVRVRVASWIERFDRQHPIVSVTSAGAITELAEDLRQVGLFDRFLRLPAPTMAAHGSDFIERMGRFHCGDSITQSAAKVGKLFSSEFESERRKQLAILRLRRFISKEKRPLEFVDLVNLTLHGFEESDAGPEDAEEIRLQTAYHEAGHAVVAVVDSDGQNVPEYSSIIPSTHSKGVVVTSYKYLYLSGDRDTYADMRHGVRVSLAGRAAEELVFGPERVSNGAKNDLEKATGSSGAAFAFFGFAPSMEKQGHAGANLSVAGLQGDDFTASEAEHIEGLVREFLSIEYAAVKELLVRHRPLLNSIALRLMSESLLDQEALSTLVQPHLAKHAGFSTVPRAEGR